MILYLKKPGKVPMTPKLEGSKFKLKIEINKRGDSKNRKTSTIGRLHFQKRSTKSVYFLLNKEWKRKY